MCAEIEKIRLFDVLEDVEQFSYFGKDILAICVYKKYLTGI